MRKGNDALQKRVGATITESPKMDMITGAGGGNVTAMHESTPRIYKTTTKNIPLVQQDTSLLYPEKSPHSAQLIKNRESTLLRHELHEARELRSQGVGPKKLLPEDFKNYLQDVGMGKEIRRGEAFNIPTEKVHAIITKPFHNDESIKQVFEHTYAHLTPDKIRELKTIEEPIGNHASLRVLGRESNDIRNNPWVRNSGMVSFRGKGESSLLKKITGKTYGSDRFTGKDLTKLHKATPDRINEEQNEKIFLTSAD
jgi:hypothetical protein